MRATICVEVSDRSKCDVVAAWFKRWQGSFKTAPENEGDGCVDMWNLNVPAKAIAELPHDVLAMSEWADPAIWSASRDIPRSWVRIDATETHQTAPLEDELSRELVAGHPLCGQSVRAIARSVDGMQICVAVGETRRVAQVDLTWSGAAEMLPWPVTLFFPSWDEWRLQLPRDDDDWY